MLPQGVREKYTKYLMHAAHFGSETDTSLLRSDALHQLSLLPFIFPFHCTRPGALLFGTAEVLSNYNAKYQIYKKGLAGPSSCSLDSE
jgi:hypothetical protein